MNRGDQYIIVKATLLELREKSVRIDRDEWSSFKWLPRGWLEPVSEKLLRKDQEGEEVSFQVLGDKAVEKGLI